jgi:Ca2+-binding EF-hand superfamily protein
MESLSSKASYIADKQLEDSLRRLNALGVIDIKVNLDIYRDTNMYVAMDLFMQADTDRSGDIDKDEFRAVMKGLGHTDESKNDILYDMIDTDKNGIDLKEFALFYRSFILFNEVDSDKSANINQDEFNALMNTLGHTDESKNKDLFGIIDTDKSDNIDYNEFYKFMVYMQNFIDADEDNSGKIEIGEFQTLMKKVSNMNNDASAELFAKLDSDMSGNLDLSEFITCMYPPPFNPMLAQPQQQQKN